MQGGDFKWSLMHYAISKANIIVIQILLESGLVKNLNAIDKNGKKAIQFCPYSSPIYKIINKFTKSNSSGESTSTSNSGMTLLTHNLFSLR